MNVLGECRAQRSSNCPISDCKTCADWIRPLCPECDSLWDEDLGFCRTCYHGYTTNKNHASLECPECGRLCKPFRNLKNGGAVYRCADSRRHNNDRPLKFIIDGDGNLDY